MVSLGWCGDADMEKPSPVLPLPLCRVIMRWGGETVSSVSMGCTKRWRREDSFYAQMVLLTSESSEMLEWWPCKWSEFPVIGWGL